MRITQRDLTAAAARLARALGTSIRLEEGSYPNGISWSAGSNHEAGSITIFAKTRAELYANVHLAALGAETANRIREYEQSRAEKPEKG